MTDTTHTDDGTGKVRVVTPYDVTLSIELYEELRRSVSRTELTKHGICIDRRNGLDCGCLICGRD